MQTAYSDDFLIQKLIGLIEKLNRFPSSVEIRFEGYQDEHFPTHNTFSKFGQKADLIKAVLNYCNHHHIKSSVVDICKRTTIQQKIQTPPMAKSKETEYGFVYLMKLGKYYKIGRSNCAERGEYELQILMPEPLKLIHKIKTDDPNGIEHYWHERFKDKKRNKSEWFDLSATDVNIFKSRKTM